MDYSLRFGTLNPVCTPSLVQGGVAVMREVVVVVRAKAYRWLVGNKGILYIRGWDAVGPPIFTVFLGIFKRFI